MNFSQGVSYEIASHLQMIGQEKVLLDVKASQGAKTLQRARVMTSHLW